jgi:hypothetical protein
MHPAYILFHALWFWSLLADEMMKDLSIKKPVLVLIRGGKAN